VSGPILDRDLNRAWLDAALRVARQQLPLVGARRQLREALHDAPLGEAALKKTVTVLTRIWLGPVERRAGHALWAIHHADGCADWRPLHLGALLADEPFMRSLLDACGREQRAKGEISTIALRSRMRNVHGPKRSIDIATQRGVKTLRSLGVLLGEPQASVSNAGTVPIAEPDLAAWLVHCLLMGRRAESIAIEDLGHAPELFALRLPGSLPRSAAGVTKHAEGVGRVVLALDS
jgi:hypothetical protein